MKVYAAVLALVVFLGVAASEISTQTQRDEILEYHRKARTSVTPTPANMHKVDYVLGLEELADKWAQKCDVSLNPDDFEEYKMYGQNIIESKDNQSWSKLASKWFAESQHYDFDSNQCDGDCSHYKQMVFSTVTEMGCAMHLCETVAPKNEGPEYLFVCQYDEIGDIGALQPYVKGEFCSKCPRFTTCEANLCTYAPCQC